MKLHLSGPMTGLPDFNRAEFNRVAGILGGMGHEVFNPAVLANGPYRNLLLINLSWICTEAEGIVSLAGWSNSKGARVEAAAAWAIGMPHFLHAEHEKDGPLFLPYSAEGNPAKAPLGVAPGRERAA